MPRYTPPDQPSAYLTYTIFNREGWVVWTGDDPLEYVSEWAALNQELEGPLSYSGASSPDQVADQIAAQEAAAQAAAAEAARLAQERVDWITAREQHLAADPARRSLAIARLERTALEMNWDLGITEPTD